MADAMDSKSISREGSRGSSPRPGTSVGAEPSISADGELAAALLPVVLHELNNHTQYLAVLAALARSGAPDASADSGLAPTANAVRELGWVLGLVAAADGADYLRDRSEADGLAPVVRCVRQALRREGRDLARADREMPRLSPRVGWRGARRAGVLLLACGRASATPLEFEIRADGDALALACRVDRAALAADVAALASDGPEPGWCAFRVAPEVRA